MILYSRTCAHAIRGLTWLALRQSEGYLLAETLGRQAGVPRPFLVKVLQRLVREGLLVSARGRGGGFALVRPAAEITLQEIVEAVDGAESVRQCVVGLPECNDQQPCPQHEAWRPIRQQIERFLRQTTLADMSAALERKLQLRDTADPTADPTVDPRELGVVRGPATDAAE